jgi:hypothetical protein
MRSLTIATVLLTSLSVASAAGASGRDTKERAAKKACLAGDARKGVEILADLYIDTGNPTYIFNQGRCYSQNNLYAEAVSRFREYLIKAVNATDQEKAEAEKHIANCQSYLADQRAQAQPVAPAEAPKPAPPVATAPGPGPTPVATVVSQPAPAGEKGSGLRTAGVITASVGGAALIAGVIFNLKVNSMTSDLEQTNNYNRSTDSTRKDYKTLGWIGYSVGAACAAGGGILYYLGWNKGTSTNVALVPTAAPGTLGAALAGGF